VVADEAGAGRLPALVVDPVMVSSTGRRLLDDDATRVFLKRLLPAATVFTPNRLEAEVLLDREIRTVDDQQQAASDLAARTAGAGVGKGGQATPDACDVACDVVAYAAGREVMAHARIDTKNTHGSGCSLASAIAAHLASGAEPLTAVHAAREFVN